MGLALVSIILSILGLAYSTLYIFAIVAGVAALVFTLERSKNHGVRVSAILGIVIAVAGTVYFLIRGPVVPIRYGDRAAGTMIRLVDAARLKGIGTACLIYSVDNDGAFPPNLQTLVDVGELSTRELQNPADRDSNDTCDYFFAMGLRRSDPEDWIVAFSDPEDFGREGANMLFRGGHVLYKRETEFAELLELFKAAYEEDRGEPPVIIPPS